MLEAVQIGQQHRHRVLLPHAPRQLFPQGLENRAAVQQPGQAVVGRLLAQRFAGLQQLLLQFQDAPSGAQPHPQFVRVEGLGEVIVGARLHALHQVLGVGSGSQQHNINVRLPAGGANPPADFHPVHPGHHPIQKRQAR